MEASVTLRRKNLILRTNRRYTVMFLLHITDRAKEIKAQQGPSREQAEDTGRSLENKGTG